MKPLAKKRAHATGIVLGSGSFGTVIEVMVGQEIYAAKRYRTVPTDNFIRKISLEANILSNVKHPNIVQYYGLCCHAALDVPLLLMERLMTSLHSYLLEHARTSIALPKKLAFLCDVASGLSYLHSLNPVIIHRDLTAKNVLLDISLTAKIADFGNSRIIDLDAEMTPDSMTAQPGTLDYMPPEGFGENAKYTTSLDMFSFGHLALVVIAQKNIRLPVPKVKPVNSQQICTELERRKPYFDVLSNIISDEHSIVPVIRQCLSDDPEQRPSANEIESALLEVVGSHYHERKKAKKLSKCECTCLDCCLTTVPSFTGDRVTLTELQLLKTPSGKRVDVIECLASKWKEFGMLLDFDATGNALDIIERDHKIYGCTECCKAMFTLWLQGKGRQPVTWAALFELLKDFEQTQLLDEVYSALRV